MRACVIKRVRPILYGPPCMGQLEILFTGWAIKIKPQRNSYTKGCVKMRALQQ